MATRAGFVGLFCGFLFLVVLFFVLVLLFCVVVFFLFLFCSLLYLFTSLLGCHSANSAPANSAPETAYMPALVLWVMSFIQPMMEGLTNPARLPTELISAMPAAAAVPDSIALG